MKKKVKQNKRINKITFKVSVTSNQIINYVRLCDIVIDNFIDKTFLVTYKTKQSLNNKLIQSYIKDIRESYREKFYINRIEVYKIT
jgi:hypothetical protein